VYAVETTLRPRAPGRSVPDRIRMFNDRRDPERLRLKYKAMAKSAFAFFRGTCHLFWEDWHAGRVLDRAPLVWACGDLHFENFGAFNGDNRLDYFDLNDFDESALAPSTRDPVRCVTSLLLAAEEAKLPAREARQLCEAFVDSYAATLRDGRVRWLERDTATGVVGQLLKHLEHRTRVQLLEKRTTLRAGRRRILLGKHALPAGRKEKVWARRVLKAAAAPEERRFLRVLHVARRIAGTGSLGVERYVVLVEGKGSPRGNFLIDLKAARPSAMNVSLAPPSSRWASEAERVVWVQSHMQAASPAFLRAVSLAGSSFVLKELQPREDRLLFKKIDQVHGSLDGVVRAMGQLLSWAQLRPSGRRGAASADALVEHAHTDSWRRSLVDYASSYAKRARADHREFREAWKDGFFDRQVER